MAVSANGNGWRIDDGPVVLSGLVESDRALPADVELKSTSIDLDQQAV